MQIQQGTPEWERIAREAARTIPGRENGGNCDIKNLSRGSKIYLPVFVDGANLSTGDMHFSQGDGEVSFCGAIELNGFLELKYISHLSLSPSSFYIYIRNFAPDGWLKHGLPNMENLRSNFQVWQFLQYTSNMWKKAGQG